MGRNAIVNKEIPLSKIKERKSEIRSEWQLYEQLTFIEDIYHGENVNYAIKKRGKTIQTGHNWLKRWNEGGFEGLERKEGSGKQAKLTDEKFIKLRQMIIEKELTSNRQIKKLIRDEFGVIYTERHVSRIMDKLNFGYGKPYRIPAKAPDDASELLKKTSKKMK